ncbi:MAG: hypothetical protein WB239_18575 [Acidimicrobiia bacterium]
MTHDTPIGAIIKGALAGAAGMVAMDLVWYRRYRSGGGGQTFAEWEFSSGLDGYDNAPAPAQVGKRVIEGVFDVELAPSTVGAMNNVVHWGTGLGWGAIHGIVMGSLSKPRALMGPLTGAGAWLASYAVLAPAGLYKPLWEYDPETLWKDLSAHLAFGAGLGAVFRILARR